MGLELEAASVEIKARRCQLHSWSFPSRSSRSHDLKSRALALRL